MAQEFNDEGGTPVKAFLVYVGQVYYPGAVTQDLVCSVDTLEEAHAERILRTDPSDPYEWWSIVDHRTMQIVSDGSGTEKEDYPL